MAKPKTPSADTLAQIDALEIGQVYELTCDVENPRGDRREKYDAKQLVVWKKGTRFVVEAVRDTVVDGLTAGIDPSKMPRRINLTFSRSNRARFQLHGYRYYCAQTYLDDQAEATRIERVMAALCKVDERDWKIDDALMLTGNSSHSEYGLLKFLWERRRISLRDLEDYAAYDPDAQAKADAKETK